MALKRIAFREGYLDISYEICNTSEARQILFLHGWGSNKEVMKSAFASKFTDFCLIFVDMPGFGKSHNDTYVLTTAEYATIMNAFLSEAQLHPFCIFGHSFGGKVATLMHPQLLCLLSSAGIVEPKPFTIKAKIIIYKMLKKVFGDSLYTFFATKDAAKMPKNMYETIKNVVNENFEPIFSKYDGKALIFWGKSDTATHVSSGEKIASLISAAEFYPLPGGHYFFLEQSEEVERVFLNECNNF